MGLTSFKIAPKKALQYAECQSVPKIMVIAGPNGVGKSTLLFAIKQKQGQVQCAGRVLYLSPHRIWRRQQIHVNNLWEQPRSYSDFLMQDSISGFGGLRILDGNRAPDSADESPSAVKYTLSQVETRKQTAVNSLLESRGVVTREDVGEIYRPVQELTSFLLPHLTFSRIDTSDRNNVKCLWRRVDLVQNVEVDLDDLSSGERAIISMFMPFLETLIEQRLAKLEVAVGRTVPRAQEDMIVLIDEPDLHLHPLLQARFLEYLRGVASEGPTQFILATHSPSLLNEATYEELFLLTPPRGPGVNQLIKPASSAERLAALRELCGDTHILTSCRKVVCIEGSPLDEDGGKSADLSLYPFLCPAIQATVMIPCGGKGNVLDTARRLRDNLGDLAPIIDVLALVDADQGSSATCETWEIRLPVCMIENLLLSPRHLWEYVQTLPGVKSLTDEQATRTALMSIASGMREKEIERRVLARLKVARARPRGATYSEIRQSIQDEFGRALENIPTAEAFATLRADIETEVQRIIDAGQQLQRFHGKTIVKTFYDQFIKPHVSYHAFLTQLAAAIGKDATAINPLLSQVAPRLGISVTTQAGSPSQ